VGVAKGSQRLEFFIRQNIRHFLELAILPVSVWARHQVLHVRQFKIRVQGARNERVEEFAAVDTTAIIYINFITGEVREEIFAIQRQSSPSLQNRRSPRRDLRK